MARPLGRACGASGASRVHVAQRAAPPARVDRRRWPRPHQVERGRLEPDPVPRALAVHRPAWRITVAWRPERRRVLLADSTTRSRPSDRREHAPHGSDPPRAAAIERGARGVPGRPSCRSCGGDMNVRAVPGHSALFERGWPARAGAERSTTSSGIGVDAVDGQAAAAGAARDARGRPARCACPTTRRSRPCFAWDQCRAASESRRTMASRRRRSRAPRRRPARRSRRAKKSLDEEEGRREEGREGARRQQTAKKQARTAAAAATGDFSGKNVAEFRKALAEL